MQATLERAQAGDVGAKAELYSHFENFLQKYRNFFDSEADAIRLARQYPDVAAFLGLFMGKKMYHAVQSRKWSPQLRSQITRKVNEIVELGRELGDREDINMIIDMTFFELVTKYDPKGKVRKELKKKGIEYDMLSRSAKRKHELAIPPVGFEGYLMNVFKFRLFKNIEAETKGIIPGVGWCKALVTSPGGYDHAEDMEVNLAEHLSEDSTELIDILALNIDIDHSWIAGDTCTAPFNALSSQQRWILKMRFVERLSSRQIAESIGVSPSVIRSRFNEILTVLKKEAVVSDD